MNAAPSGDAESPLYCEIEGKPASVLPEDLSLAGVFVSSTTPLELDREIEVFLRTPIGELHARGHVVQVVDRARAKLEGRRAGFGLLFTSLGDDQRAFIGLTLDALWRAQKSARPPSQRFSAEHEVKEHRRPPDPEKEAKRAAEAQRREALRAQASRVEGELKAQLATLQGKTAWGTLGLDAEASISAAKEAFLEQSKLWHPHRYARHESAEVTRLATELFITYKRAYSVLTKLARRPEGEGATRTSSTGIRSTMKSIIPAPASTPPQPAQPSTRPRSR